MLITIKHSYIILKYLFSTFGCFESLCLLIVAILDMRFLTIYIVEILYFSVQYFGLRNPPSLFGTEQISWTVISSALFFTAENNRCSLRDHRYSSQSRETADMGINREKAVLSINLFQNYEESVTWFVQIWKWTLSSNTQ